ncbi:MAG: hypothetical protein ACJAW1_002995, partial [Glaciecola sp.]
MSSTFTTKNISAVFALIILIFCLIGFWWSFEPNVFDVDAQAKQQAQTNNQTVVTGYTTTNALIGVLENMLDKPGGYLYNDMMPPGIVMDNIPSWEFG